MAEVDLRAVRSFVRLKIARVLVAEQGLVRHPRPAPREETARLLAFSLLKEYESGWRDLLTAGLDARLGMALRKTLRVSAMAPCKLSSTLRKRLPGSETSRFGRNYSM